MAPFFVLDSFIDFLIAEKRFSEHTAIAYKKDIKQFIDYADITQEKELNEVTPRLVRGWMVELLENDYEGTSVNRKLSSLRTFFKWLVKEGVIAESPMRLVSGPKVKKRLPNFVQQKALDSHELDELFSDDFSGVRNRAIIEFFYQTGMRASELINLTDRNVGSDSIRILGKGGKERVVPITKSLANWIEKYRLEKSQIEFCNSSVFFVLDNGKPLYPKFVYNVVNKCLKSLSNLEKNSPHVLRHSFATHMMNNGAGLEVLKELLGHANLSATQVYTHNSFAKLNEIYSGAHPRGGSKRRD